MLRTSTYLSVDVVNILALRLAKVSFRG